jgi:hypothetical protein
VLCFEVSATVQSKASRDDAARDIQVQMRGLLLVTAIVAEEAAAVVVVVIIIIREAARLRSSRM